MQSDRSYRKNKSRKNISSSRSEPASEIQYRKRGRGAGGSGGGMDFQDMAYREAVTRLKFLLADSYNFTKGSAPRRSGSVLDSDASDILIVSQRPALSDISQFMSSASALSRYNPGLLKPVTIVSEPSNQKPASVLGEVATPAPELLNFIEKQETYIEQLERESNYCRQELNHLLTKVKDVISENETLTDQAKTGITTSVFKTIDSSESDEVDPVTVLKSKSKLHGPQNLLLESRISELEAKLTQSQMDRNMGIVTNPGLAVGGAGPDYLGEHFKKTIDNLKQDKSTLEETVRKLQLQITQIKENETSNFNRSLKNRDLAEHISFEKAQSDMEIRRLKEELDRQHERVRELQHEMARRISEERAIAERRYNYQVDQLGGDLTNQWEQSSKLQLDVERFRRMEADMKREIAQKASQIEELKTDIKSKCANHMSDIAQLSAEKQSVEQEVVSMRLQVEKAERNSKVEAARLNAEINSLRQRLDKSDSDVLHARRENLKLSDQIASLEKEIALGDIGKEPRPKELVQIMADMETKHANTVQTLEGLIHDQRMQMEKLVTECKSLTYKLDETTLKHKKDFGALQTNVEYLTDRVINSNNSSSNNYATNDQNLVANSNTDFEIMDPQISSQDHANDHNKVGLEQYDLHDTEQQQQSPSGYNLPDEVIPAKQPSYNNIERPSSRTYERSLERSSPPRSSSRTENNMPYESSPVRQSYSRTGSGDQPIAALGDQYTAGRSPERRGSPTKGRLSRQPSLQRLPQQQPQPGQSESRRGDDEIATFRRGNEGGAALMDQSVYERSNLGTYGNEAAPMETAYSGGGDEGAYQYEDNSSFANYDLDGAQNYGPSDGMQYSDQQQLYDSSAIRDPYRATEEYYQPQQQQPASSAYLDNVGYQYDEREYGKYQQPESQQSYDYEPKYQPVVAPSRQSPQRIATPQSPQRKPQPLVAVQQPKPSYSEPTPTQPATTPRSSTLATTTASAMEQPPPATPRGQSVRPTAAAAKPTRVTPQQSRVPAASATALSGSAGDRT